MKTPLSWIGIGLVGAAAVLISASIANAGKKDIPKRVKDTDYLNNGSVDPNKFFLGQVLFFDKILSGNRNISCATCHHPLADTGDGLSLPVGEGGQGLGVTRATGANPAEIVARVPRNAPPVFNLGTKEFDTVFHDGRIEVDPNQPSGFFNPAGADLPPGLENALAAQAMFPVTSGDEMAGHDGTNPVGTAAAAGNLAGPGGVWDLLAQRLRGIPEYVTLFQRAYPGQVTSAGDITFVHAANAIGAFEGFAWRADKSRFDRYLRGSKQALTLREQKGLTVFYGQTGRCFRCHSGKFQTDLKFHAIAMPQAGPGKGNGFLGREDFGREIATGNPADRYKFRTPTLRNVALTGPWGHGGAYNTLEAVVRHHANPIKGLNNWDRSQFVVPSRPDLDALDFQAHDNGAVRAAIGAANELPPNPKLKGRHFRYLVDFLHTLTDQNSIDLRLDVPIRVPSGLPVFD